MMGGKRLCFSGVSVGVTASAKDVSEDLTGTLCLEQLLIWFRLSQKKMGEGAAGRGYITWRRSDSWQQQGGTLSICGSIKISILLTATCVTNKHHCQSHQTNFTPSLCLATYPACSGCVWFLSPPAHPLTLLVTVPPLLSAFWRGNFKLFCDSSDFYSKLFSA